MIRMLRVGLRAVLGRSVGSHAYCCTAQNCLPPRFWVRACK